MYRESEGTTYTLPLQGLCDTLAASQVKVHAAMLHMLASAQPHSHIILQKPMLLPVSVQLTQAKSVAERRRGSMCTIMKHCE